VTGEADGQTSPDRASDMRGDVSRVRYSHDMTTTSTTAPAALTVTRDGFTFAVTASGWPAPSACTRCDGSGFIRPFSHVYAGECFECNGGRKSFPAVGTRNATTVEQAQRGHVTALKARARREAKAAAKWEADREAREAREAAALAAQIAQAEVEAYEEAARLAALVDVVEGKAVITGTVLGLKSVESTFGYRTTTTMKMLVADDRGFKVFGTAPVRLAQATEAGTYAALKGMRVTFTATVEAGRDRGFGYFTRPTKVAILPA
jgi:hypothetical protein